MAETHILCGFHNLLTSFFLVFLFLYVLVMRASIAFPLARLPATLCQQSLRQSRL